MQIISNLEQFSNQNGYSVNILHAKYPIETRRTLGLVLTIILVIGAPCLDLIARIMDLNLNLDFIQLYFLFITAFSFFLFFQIISKVINKTFVIGIAEITEKNIHVKTKNIDKTILLNDIDTIKYKASRRFISGKTPPHNISNTVLFSIVCNDNSTCNIHITQYVFKNGIKQKNNSWTADGNVFDILQRKKIIPVFERELEEKNCLKS
jgi:hypothetical protein